MNKKNVIITIVSVLILTCLFAFARTTTTDLGLVKPVWTEDLDILADINANTDILEAFANDPLEFDSDLERLEDRVGAMWAGNTETFITVTYQDVDNTVDAVVPVKDEDDMTSNSATVLATQQSIKAYADTLHALQYLKTEIDTLIELEAIWGKDVTDSIELASALTDYYLKTAIDTLGEVEAMYGADITDSVELAAALTDYYLKTAIDTIGEMETIWSKDIIDSTELTDANIPDDITIESATSYVKSEIRLIVSDANPDTTGEIKHDSSVVGMAGGALRWFDNDSSRLIVDLETDPSADDYVVTYDADADGFYMKVDADTGGNVNTSGVPVQYDFARFTDSATIEGRDSAEVKADLNLEIGTDILAQQTIGIANNNLLEVDDADAADNDYAKFTVNGLEGRDSAEVKTDLGFMADLADDASPQLAEQLQAGAHSINFTEQVLTSGAAIAWNLGNSNKATLFAAHNFTTTITAPSGALNAQLIVTQDAIGSRVMDEIVTQSDTSITAAADVNTSTNTITVTVDIPKGARIRFKTSASDLPDPLVVDTIYYAFRISATELRVATTKANAFAATVIDLIDQGTGTHTVQQLVKWPSGTLGVLSTVVGSEDIVSLTYKTADKQWYAILGKNFQ
jgi:hypothetical protein